MRLGLLTAADWPGLPRDDQLVIPYLAAAGIAVEPVIWTRPLPAGLDALVMRATWGYFHQPEAFVAWLQALGRTGLPLFNPLPVLLDNLDKRYLLRLQQRGHPIVPTQVLEAGAAAGYAARVAASGWDELIVKPAISASGHETHRLRAADSLPASLIALNAERPLLIQPFCPAIQTEGEWSLVFFAGPAGPQFSHAVCKRPAAQRFLVQEDHGGRTEAAAPPPELLQLAARVAAEVCHDCLYARIDCVRLDAPVGSGYGIMELELLEPSLYLAHEPGAPARWARSLQHAIGGNEINP